MDYNDSSDIVTPVGLPTIWSNPIPTRPVSGMGGPRSPDVTYHADVHVECRMWKMVDLQGNQIGRAYAFNAYRGWYEAYDDKMNPIKISQYYQIHDRDGKLIFESNYPKEWPSSHDYAEFGRRDSKLL